jgi:hypothetical protein
LQIEQDIDRCTASRVRYSKVRDLPFFNTYKYKTLQKCGHPYHRISIGKWKLGMALSVMRLLRPSTSAFPGAQSASSSSIVPIARWKLYPGLLTDENVAHIITSHFPRDFGRGAIHACRDIYNNERVHSALLNSSKDMGLPTGPDRGCVLLDRAPIRGVGSVHQQPLRNRCHDTFIYMGANPRSEDYNQPRGKGCLLRVRSVAGCPSFTVPCDDSQGGLEPPILGVLCWPGWLRDPLDRKRCSDP